MRPLRVLVGCEFSGTVRDAWRRAGHDAHSVDLLPDEGQLGHDAAGNPVHHVMDIFKFLELHPPHEWDLFIHHAPCTYSTISGARWLYTGGRGKVRDEDRWAKMRAGAAFFRNLQEQPFGAVCGENPVPHRHARPLMGGYYSQTVQPWNFGCWETKRTGFWLRELPPLEVTYPDEEAARIALGLPAGSKPKPRVHYESPGEDRGKRRSVFYKVFADAMVAQWAPFLLAKLARTTP